MRVIKFRGKRIDNGEWVYGCCGYGFDQVVRYIMPNMYVATKDFGWGLGISEDNLGNYISDEVALGGFIAVDSSTVGQFTGLFDKNGNPPIRYNAVEKALKTVNSEAIKLKATIHSPYMGCGLAGGIWGIMEAVILETITVPMYIYELYLVSNSYLL